MSEQNLRTLAIHLARHCQGAHVNGGPVELYFKAPETDRLGQHTSTGVRAMEIQALLVDEGCHGVQLFLEALETAVEPQVYSQVAQALQAVNFSQAEVDTIHSPVTQLPERRTRLYPTAKSQGGA